MNNTNLTYDINLQAIRDLRQLPGGTPRSGKSQGKRPAIAPQHSACRIIVMLINHHTGTPFGAANAELDGLLPSERAILTVGISGMRRSGEPIRRMAIYGYRDGRAQMRFPVNFDPITGDPQFSGDGLPREAELAAVNWMQGAMFNTELVAGTYDFQDRVLSEEMPLRREFASERRTEASVDMFSRHFGHKVQSADFTLPEVNPLLTPGQLPASVNPSSLPVREIPMSPVSYIAHAVDRFVLGLHSAAGDGFKELKRAYIKQFDIADDTIHATQSDPSNGYSRLASICAEQTGLGCDVELSQQHSILKFAHAYLQGLNLSPEAAQSAGLITYQAIRLLENYFLNRMENGKVLMFAPSQNCALDEQLFSKPSSYTVSGSPVLICNGYSSSGMFPYLAGDLIPTEYRGGDLS